MQAWKNPLVIRYIEIIDIRFLAGMRAFLTIVLRISLGLGSLDPGINLFEDFPSLHPGMNLFEGLDPWILGIKSFEGFVYFD